MEIKTFFDSLNETEIIDKELLTEFLLKQVGIGFRGRDFAIKEGEYLPSKGFKIKIWPDELARLLIFLHSNKDKINSFLEFGTGNGGSFLVIDSYLRSINPNMGKSVTLDQHNYRPKGIDEYVEKHPEATCYSDMKTSSFEMEFYDFCFIDASHSYKSVKRDYEKVGNYCKFIAFHDILTMNQRKPDQLCVRHLWQEIESDNKMEIVISSDTINALDQHLQEGIRFL